MTPARIVPESSPAIYVTAVAYTLEIHNLLTRFFAAFDEKKWVAIRNCLCEEIFADYSAFCDVRPRVMPAAEYIEERRLMLDWLDTQHNFHNLRVNVDEIEGTATARCNYVIRRFHPGSEGNQYFHSYGYYYFDFISLHGEWRIARIKQHLLRNEGGRDVHPSVWCA
jgi:hypothetical protein